MLSAGHRANRTPRASTRAAPQSFGPWRYQAERGSAARAGAATRRTSLQRALPAPPDGDPDDRPHEVLVGRDRLRLDAGPLERRPQLGLTPVRGFTEASSEPRVVRVDVELLAGLRV